MLQLTNIALNKEMLPYYSTSIWGFWAFWLLKTPVNYMISAWLIHGAYTY